MYHAAMAKPSAREKEVRRQAKLKRKKAKLAQRVRADAGPDLVILTGRERERVFGKQKVSDLLQDYAKPIVDKLPGSPPALWMREFLQAVADTWNRGMNFPAVSELDEYSLKCKELAARFAKLLKIDEDEAFELVAFMLKRRMDEYSDKQLVFGPVEVVDELTGMRVMASAALMTD